MNAVSIATIIQRSTHASQSSERERSGDGPRSASVA